MPQSLDNPELELWLLLLALRMQRLWANRRFSGIFY
jgi:hypothetical protein